jgi:hypothetical protein
VTKVYSRLFLFERQKVKQTAKFSQITNPSVSMPNLVPKGAPSPGAFACNVTIHTRALQQCKRRTERYNAHFVMKQNVFVSVKEENRALQCEPYNDTGQ